MNQSKTKKILLLGHPNVGKSTVFNTLTNGNASTGNWSGVTVDVKAGRFATPLYEVDCYDLPGIVSLTQEDAVQGTDEALVAPFLRDNHPDLIVNVIDACALEAQLYLTMQLREMGVPMIVVLTMNDQAEKQNRKINIDALSELLKVPVLKLIRGDHQSTHWLKHKMDCVIGRSAPASPVIYPEMVEQAIEALCQSECQQTRWEAIQCLSGDTYRCHCLSAEQQQLLQSWQSACGAKLGHEIDLLIADTLLTWIQDHIQEVVAEKGEPNHVTTWIDRIVLNRYLGIPIFFLVLYCMFLFAIDWMGALQDKVDLLTEWVFVDGLAYGLQALSCPDAIVSVMAHGLGRGINTTLTFIPVLVGIYTYLALLEGSGYMSRAAFVMDRLMTTLGLPGHAFVPLIIGFGCNVPAVMATRTLNSARDRLITSMMVPFMSCSARLAIFSVFAAAFFPEGGGTIIFILYLLGVLAAILTGYLLRHMMPKANETPLVMSLPVYHFPKATVVLRQVKWRVWGFIRRAGKIIIPLSMALSLLTMPGMQNHSVALRDVGQTIGVVLSPMGVEKENWPASVGLLSGVLAKEIVIGTLNTLYAHPETWGEAVSQASFWEKGQDVATAFRIKDVSQEASSVVSVESAMGNFSDYFHSDASVMAYLIFVLLYFPCVSTFAVLVREVSKSWAIISVSWATVLAYAVAVIVYQSMTLSLHPLASTLWVLGIILAMGVFYRLIAYYSQQSLHRLEEGASC